jgi:hypothetical protein
VSGGSLLEDVYQGAGEPPTTTFPATPTQKRILIDRVRRVSGTTPYFRYYAYDTSTPTQPSVEVKPPFLATDNKRIARVVVAFDADAIGEKNDQLDANFVNGVTTRIADPANTDVSSRGPQCT